MDKNIITDFNLPTYVKGKSFSEASKAIDKKFKDRNDTISQRTKDELLNRLSQAQEYIKDINSLNEDTNDAFFGGEQTATPPINPANGPSIGPGAVMGMLSSGLEFGNNIFGKSGIDPNSAENINPNDINIAGGTIGNALKGAQAGMALGPIGAGVGALVGGVSGLIGGNKAKKDALKAKQNYDFSLHNKATKDYFLGGEIEDPINREAIDNTFNNLTIGDNASLYGMNLLEENKSLPKFGDTKVGKSINKGLEFLNENGSDIMRYAPVAMNAYQLATLDKPEIETLQRLNNKYVKDPFDINTLTNKIQNEYSGLSDRLASASGGDSSTLRSNLLAAQVNKTNAVSDAYSRGESINRADRLREQEFNLGIDKFNVGQSNLQNDINARNRAAYSNEKSKLLSALGTDLGNIGKEGVTKKQAKELFGYDWKGKYVKDNPKASKEEVNEAFKSALIKRLYDMDLSNAYGGYLKR